MNILTSIPWLNEANLLLGIINVILLGCGIIFYIKISLKLRKYRFLSKGNEDKNLEEILLATSEREEVTRQGLNKLEERFVNNMAKEDKHIQNCGLVRFQAFQNTGGDLSFALALLDAHGNGVVLSSLFGRDESRVYCKPVEEGKSTYPLSKEEQKAIEIAIGNSGKNYR